MPIKAHSRDKTIYYIDPSASVSGGGDGTSLANAASQFPSTLSADHLYLIRRCAESSGATSGSGDLTIDQCAKIPAGTHNASDIMIMGMPKSGDKELAYLQSIMDPADYTTLINSAWYDESNNAPQYANVFVEITQSPGAEGHVAPVKFSACENFSMSRVKFLLKYTQSSYDYSSSYNNNYKAGLAFTSSTIATSFNFNNCIFKMAGYDITNANVPFSILSDSNVANKYGRGYRHPFTYIFANNSLSGYDYSKMAANFVITNCQIQKNGLGRAFYAKSISNFIAKDLEIYLSTSASDNRQNAVFAIENGSSSGLPYISTKAIIDNINIHQSFVTYRAISNSDSYESSNYDYLMTTFYFNHLRDIICTNISATKNNNNSMTPNSNIVGTNPIIDATINNGSGKFENITINYPFCKALKNSLLKVVSRPIPADNEGTDEKINMYHPQNRQFITFKNIGITTAGANGNTVLGYNEPDNYSYPSPFYEASNSGNSTSSDSANASPNKGALFLQLMENDYKNRHHLVNDAFILTAVTLTCKVGAALYADNAILDLNNKTISGGVSLRNCVGKINKIESWYPGRVVYDRGDNLLYIGEVECYRNNGVHEYDSTPLITPSWGSHILLGASNTKFMPEGFNTGANGICSYICRSEEATGNYTVMNQLMKAKTWSVHRTGGTSCTIKFEHTSEDNSYSNNPIYTRPLFVGGEPFGGVKKQVTPSTTSLTFYVTTFGYSNPSTADLYKYLKIKVTLPNGTILTSDDGNWYADADSQWQEISNGTAFKFVLPIKSGLITATGNAKIEYSFNWFKNGAATFLDPFPV